MIFGGYQIEFKVFEFIACSVALGMAESIAVSANLLKGVL